MSDYEILAIILMFLNIIVLILLNKDKKTNRTLKVSVSFLIRYFGA